MKDKLSISQIGNVLVVRKSPRSRVFLTTGDSFIIDKGTFITLLNYIVQTNIIDPKVLEGILEEYNTE